MYAVIVPEPVRLLKLLPELSPPAEPELLPDLPLPAEPELLPDLPLPEEPELLPEWPLPEEPELLPEEPKLSSQHSKTQVATDRNITSEMFFIIYNRVRRCAPV